MLLWVGMKEGTGAVSENNENRSGQNPILEATLVIDFFLQEYHFAKSPYACSCFF